MFRKKAIDVQLPLPKVSAKHRELYDALTGKRNGKLYNATGLLLGEQSALLHVGDDRIFIVALAIGDEIYRVGEVHKSNPQVLALTDQMIVFGPSPAELERKRLEQVRAQMTRDEYAKEVEDTYRSWGCNVSQPSGGVEITEQRNKPKNYRDLPVV